MTKKPQSKIYDAMKEIGKSTLVLSGIGFLGAGIFFSSISIDYQRYTKSLERNNCQIVTQIATAEDALGGYSGIAKKIIQTPNTTLKTDMDVNGLTDKLIGMNKGNKLTKGRKYYTFECNGCQK